MKKDEEQISVDEQKTEVLDLQEVGDTSSEEAKIEERIEAGKKRFSRRTKIGLVAAGIIAALLACLCIGYIFGSHETSNYIAEQTAVEESATTDEESTNNEDNEDTITDEASHEHNWGPNYELQHVDAVTHTVDHPAQYEAQTTYHTVCNTCMQVIDNEATAHIAQTGHSGYSTNVPITSDVMVQEAWTETVVDEEAYDQLVVNGEICSICGETRNVSKQLMSESHQQYDRDPAAIYTWDSIYKKRSKRRLALALCGIVVLFIFLGILKFLGFFQFALDMWAHILFLLMEYYCQITMRPLICRQLNCCYFGDRLITRRYRLKVN